MTKFTVNLMHFLSSLMQSVFPKQIFAIVVHGKDEDQKFMIKLVSKDGWHFPGVKTFLFNTYQADVEIISKYVVSEIDCIKIDNVKFIGNFWTHGFAQLFLITVTGNHSSKAGMCSAKFVHDLSPYNLSKTGKKIRGIYNKYINKNTKEKLSSFSLL